MSIERQTASLESFFKVGERYIKMLCESVKTWPPSKRMTLVAIETISRAMNATLASQDYTNVTAAVSDCVTQLMN